MAAPFLTVHGAANFGQPDDERTLMFIVVDETGATAADRTMETVADAIGEEGVNEIARGEVDTIVTLDGEGQDAQLTLRRDPGSNPVVDTTGTEPRGLWLADATEAEEVDDSDALLIAFLPYATDGTGHDDWTIDNDVLAVSKVGEIIGVHNDLEGRDATACHPIAAITGLQAVLESFPTDAYALTYGDTTVGDVLDAILDAIGPLEGS